MPQRRRPRTWLKHVPAALLAVSGISLAAGLAASERNPVSPTPRASAASEQARVIVRYKSGASLLRTHAAQAGSGPSRRHAQALAERHGLNLADGRMLAERMQLVLGSGINSKVLASKLTADPDVEWAVVDGRRYKLVAPSDPLYPNGLSGTTPESGQWYLRANSGSVKSSINVEPAWTQATGSGITVAVLDTGITSHPDLNSKVVQGYDFVGYSGDASVATANDGNLDDANPQDPGDWITAAEDSENDGEFEGCGESDSSWHGTQVAGIIGAVTDNGAGMAGIARDAQVLPVRVLGKCGGYDSDIIAGMYWAAGLNSDNTLPANANPAKVLNLSLGSQDECSDAYRAAMTDLTAAGVVVVAAAGNDGLTVGVPANCPGMVAVAGLRHVGTKVGFSNLGPEITVGAPGGNCVNETGTCLYPLLSTSNTGTKGPVASTYSNGDDHLTLGTSFSSPIVAGTVALMLEANPALTPAQVTSALKTSARAYPTTGGDSSSTACTAPTDTPQDSECYCTTSTCGAGMTDAGGAVSRAKTGPFPAVGASNLTPIAGASVTVNSSGSSVLAGRSIASYQWSITDGADIASISSATNASSATVKTTGAGHVEVQLTLTDNLGASTSIRQPLDASASALAAAINASPTAPEAGDTVALNASSSIVDAGRSITAYAWEITSGANLASLTGATNASTATLTTTAAGQVTVRLTITDSAGVQDSVNRTLTISPVSTDGGGGGGGGAMSPLWGLGLLVAALALRRKPVR
jgi:serine protease